MELLIDSWLLDVCISNPPGCHHLWLFSDSSTSSASPAFYWRGEWASTQTFFEVLYLYIYVWLLKSHYFQTSSPGEMYSPGSCNIVNQWLVITLPGLPFSPGNGSTAPSVRNLTSSALGTFTFMPLQLPTHKATPGFYLGWLLLHPWNLRQQGPTLWPLPLIFPELSHHTGPLTSSWIPGSGRLPPSLPRLSDLSLSVSLLLIHWWMDKLHEQEINFLCLSAT